jgi:hypothetical protein
MEVWKKFIERTGSDKDVLESYTTMRKTLQDFNVSEWQLKKGYRIPGAIYNMRETTIRDLFDLEEQLKKYGLLSKENLDEFKEYIFDKFKMINAEYPLQNGNKPDFMDDED